MYLYPHSTLRPKRYNSHMHSGYALIYSLLGGIVPSLVWLWFWIREDKAQPEPRGLLALTFLGGFLAVIAAIFAEKFVSGIVSDQSTKYILWAVIEETFKFGLVAVIALASSKNDEPIDAMVYCIVMALGFSALENTLFIWNPFTLGDAAQATITGGMRFMGATLVHVVSSGAVGFALGMAFFRSHTAKAVAVLLGLAAAITLHAAFNLSIIDADAANTLRTFAWIWGAVVLLLVFFEEVKAVKPRTAVIFNHKNK